MQVMQRLQRGGMLTRIGRRRPAVHVRQGDTMTDTAAAIDNFFRVQITDLRRHIEIG